MRKKQPVLTTLITGICILIDKYAAKIRATETYIKPEFELLRILICYLVIYQETTDKKDKAKATIIAIAILTLTTLISVAKIYYYQV